MNENEVTKLALAMKTDCIAFRVRLLNRVITNLYDTALQPLGITVNQATILIMLSLVGRAVPADVCKALVMEKSTVSRNLDRMRKNGWIATAGREGGYAVTVTPVGHKLLADMHGVWQTAQDEAAHLLGEEGIVSLLALHETVRQTTLSA